MTRGEVLANAALFLTAGFETTATSVQFFCYNMAMNPDIQEKVSSRWQRLQGRYTSYLTNIYVRLVLTHIHRAPAVFIDEKSLTQIMIVKD